MTKPIARDPIYRGRRFQSEIIELCVRWYLTYRLSYRDLVAMMAERGVRVSHTTIFRWVQQYVPEFDRRWSRYATPVHSSWRMDETAISVRGGVADAEPAQILFLNFPSDGDIVDADQYARRELSKLEHPATFVSHWYCLEFELRRHHKLEGSIG
jgi:transposase-like protein